MRSCLLPRRLVRAATNSHCVPCLGHELRALTTVVISETSAPFPEKLWRPPFTVPLQCCPPCPFLPFQRLTGKRASTPRCYHEAKAPIIIQKRRKGGKQNGTSPFCPPADGPVISLLWPVEPAEPPERLGGGLSASVTGLPPSNRLGLEAGGRGNASTPFPAGTPGA